MKLLLSYRIELLFEIYASFSVDIRYLFIFCPNLTDPRDIYQNMDWWIFNSFGGPTLDTSDIDPETGAPTIPLALARSLLFVCAIVARV